MEMLFSPLTSVLITTVLEILKVSVLLLMFHKLDVRGYEGLCRHTAV